MILNSDAMRYDEGDVVEAGLGITWLFLGVLN